MSHWIFRKSLSGRKWFRIQSYSGTLLSTCRKASLTLEAAVILPLVATFLTFLLFFFRVMQVEEEIQNALFYAGRETAVTTAVVEGEGVGYSMAAAFFYNELGKSQPVSGYVMGGRFGVSLAESSLQGDSVDLRATYRVRFPLSLFLVDGITMVSESRHCKWTGVSRSQEKQEDIVYYTESGTVYHLSTACPYLDLSIHMAARNGIDTQRNKQNERYTPCSLCEDRVPKGDLVYITDYGSCYHSSLQCSGIKRTIIAIPRSEVGNRRLCSKCKA